jgi:ssDNA-binding Zn-finger/Zn-ribbon topoisomerase 1
VFEIDEEVEVPLRRKVGSRSSVKSLKPLTADNSAQETPKERCLECPKCDFEVTFIVDETPGLLGSRRRDSQLTKARSTLTSHFLGNHLSIELKDLTPHRSNKSKLICYSCPDCEFQTAPLDKEKFLEEKGDRLWLRKRHTAMHSLFKHYKEQHCCSNRRYIMKSTAVTSRGLETDVRLKDGKDYFRCPKAECKFLVLCLRKGQSVGDHLEDSHNVRKARRLTSLSKLGRHYMQAHDFPEGDFSSRFRNHPCVPKEKTCYLCPRCDFTVLWTGDKGKHKDYDKFSWHYSKHLYKNGVQLNPQPLVSPFAFRGEDTDLHTDWNTYEKVFGGSSDISNSDFGSVL